MAGEGRKTFVAGEVLLAQELNDYLMDQSVMNFATEAARSSAIPTPTEGMLALTLDTDEIDYYNGSAWVPALPIGAWQSWSPVLSAGWLNGNGTWDAKYCQIGKTVHVRANFTVGSTTTKGTDMRISLPVTANHTSQTWNCNANVAGGTQYSMLIRMETTTALRVVAQNAAATYTSITQVTSTVPGTWATGDNIAFQITYEAA
jgi:hypothetical protein